MDKTPRIPIPLEVRKYVFERNRYVLYVMGISIVNTIPDFIAVLVIDFINCEVVENEFMTILHQYHFFDPMSLNLNHVDRSEPFEFAMEFLVNPI